MEFRELFSTTVLLGIVLLPLVTSNYMLDSEDYPTASWGESHNLIQGRISYGDRLLHTQIVRASWKFLRRAIIDFRYPPSGNSYSYGDYPRAYINYIGVFDLRSDGYGGYPSIISGGVGRTDVTIRLKSKFNRSMAFNVTIYGTYR